MRRQRLRAQRDAWKAHAELAEAWIVDHVKELLPDGRHILLRDPELTKFRLHTVNGILAKHGLEVRARLTDTPQVVACETGPQRWEQKSRFRLVRVVPGVKPEPEEDEAGEPAAVPEASPDGSTV